MIPRPKKMVEEMDPYSPPLEERNNYLRLDFNENTSEIPGLFRKQLRNITTDNISSYPRYRNLYKALARFTKYPESQIIATNGTDEAIKLVVDCYCDCNDEVVLLSPSYSMYRFYSQLNGAKIRSVSYGNDFEFPTGQLLNKVSRRTRLLFLGNPNNPTGTTVPSETIPQISRKMKNGIIFVDEAYYEFNRQSVVNYVKKLDNVVVSRTFSKAYGLAGLRIGFMVGPKEMVSIFKKAHSPYSVNQIAVELAIYAMKKSKSIKRYSDEIIQNREFLKRKLNRLGVKTFPSKANFILVDMGEKAEKVIYRLKAKGILIRNMKKIYGAPGLARITVGTRNQIDMLLNELNSIWKSL